LIEFDDGAGGSVDGGVLSTVCDFGTFTPSQYSALIHFRSTGTKKSPAPSV